MGLLRFLKSLLGKPQETDAAILAKEVSDSALVESGEMSVSAKSVSVKQENTVPQTVQDAVIPDGTGSINKEVTIKATEEETEEDLEPIPSQMAPFMVGMIKGRSYKLCRCGRSKKHPFCDDSHKAEGCKHKPYIFKPEHSGYHSICGCMESYDYPICDGTHDFLL